MTTLLGDAINYHAGSVLHSTYQYTRVYPQEGQNSYTITNNAGPVLTFQIAPTVMNLSESSLLYTISLPTQRAGNSTWMNVNGMKHLINVTVTTSASGDYLMNIPDIDRYLDITARRSFAFEDVQTWDTAIPYNAAGANGGQSFYEGLVPTNFVAAQTSRLDGTASVKVGQESEYAISSALNTAFYFDVKFKFNKFVDTILAMNHNSYYAFRPTAKHPPSSVHPQTLLFPHPCPHRYHHSPPESYLAAPPH